jgi:hypothetical protein
MHVIEGKQLCGKEASSTFVTALRPSVTINGARVCDAEKGLLPCSTVTSEENTICYIQAQPKEEQCPILQIEFFETTLDASRAFVDKGFTVLRFD